MTKIPEETKISILSKIKEEKVVLFGSFSNILTKKHKCEKWKEIYNLARSLNAIPQNKDWGYVRDVFWQNMKKRAIAKVENSKKSGCAGGKENVLTTCDNIVLDIVGRKSEEVIKLGVPESLAFDTSNGTSSSGCFATINTVANVNLPQTQTCKRKKGEIRSFKRESPFASKKRKLTLENLEISNYKGKLEIALLERKLGFPPSTFTKSLMEPIMKKEIIKEENSECDESDESETIHIERSY